MLVSMKSILEDANKHYYGVMAMNSINIEMVRGGILGAAEENSPIIIQFGPGQMRSHAHKEELFPVIKELAERVHIPVALNLDHGMNFSDIVECIKMGFTNVMFDGSNLSYEENSAKTELLCQMAHSVGCSVEAELGHVGLASNEDDSNSGLYTDPESALEFVQYTGVDALAVAIGTAHGNYPKGKIPKLDFDRLNELKQTLNMPLVLHGGSGCGEENLKQAIELGINKINVATDAFSVAKMAMLEALKSDPSLDYMHLCMEAEKGIKDFVKKYIHVIGSQNRYFFNELAYIGYE